MLFYDFEVFKYDWLVVIKDTDKRQTIKIVNDPKTLKKVYEENSNNIWIGYNSRAYDQYILKGILLDMNPKEINDWIIVKKLGGWQYSRAFNDIQLYNYDIMTSFHGLKQLEAFMGNDIRETTVDFDIDRKLTPDEIAQTLFYCNHDVEQTMEVFMHRTEEFESQMQLIKTFKLPLKYISKTKAQLSAIILGAYKKGERNDEFEITTVPTLRLNKYLYIKCWYENPVNQDYKKKLDVNVGGINHLFGWGGLHGAKKNYIDEGIFVNSDVGSFYPSLMIEYDFLSRNVRDKSKYKEIYDIRMDLKHAGKKKEQAPYKIVLNGTYGASKDKYNNLYDPLQANNVCINGQLLLLDLIEKLEVHFQLIQSNTDGVMFKLDSKDDIPKYEAICQEWSDRTKMKLDHDIIKKVVQKDVNNYLVVMENGKVKSKGAYLKKLDKLDYDLAIVNEAMINYFIDSTPVEDTINACNELIKFQKVVKVSNKYKYALHGDKKLNDKVLRVFASRSIKDEGVYKLKIGKVKKDKIGGTPEKCFIENGDINNISIPRKLDKKWYIEVAKKRINDFVKGRN